MPGAMDFVRFGSRIATIHQDKVEALKLVHHHTTKGIVHLDSKHLSDEILKLIEQIYTAEEPAVRIDLLFSMIAMSRRLFME
ncbi:hypothetical protein B738_21108 [Photorhabdus temperata subsp. temperata M1021]|nr:hypothetical protein B738_21108 [Photorhabdus temperata subsp. temperata M1021]